MQQKRKAKKYKVISWSRDRSGKIVNHNFKDVCNTITTFSASGLTQTIYVLEYENNKIR